MSSIFGHTYKLLYDTLCGRHPHEFPWHFQWLSSFYLKRALVRQSPRFGGRVLDAGCGEQPYRHLFGDLIEYTGLDVVPGPKVDLVVAPDQQWPVPDGVFDVVLSTQMIEHSSNLELTLKEMTRVLKPNGMLILTFPFLYNVHGAPCDYRRFTHFGARQLLPGYEIVQLETQGGIGSTLAILFLNWIDASLNLNKATRMLKAILLPVYMVFSLGLNLLGLFLDYLDRSGSFYSNVLLVARKHCE